MLYVSGTWCIQIASNAEYTSSASNLSIPAHRNFDVDLQWTSQLQCRKQQPGEKEGGQYPLLIENDLVRLL